MALKKVLDSIEDLDPAIAAEYEERDGKFHLQVEGQLKTDQDVTRLTNSLTKERNDHKTAKEKLKLFEGLDPVEVQEKLARFPELEELATGKVDETKINALVETRIKTRIAPVERERDSIKTQLQEAQQTIASLQTEGRSRTLQEEVRKAALAGGVRKEAIDDALLLAERVFEVNDENKVVVRSNAQGYTEGLDPVAWLTEVKDKRSHWWGESTGGGSKGSGGVGNSANPFLKGPSWNLTEQGKIQQSNPARADQLRRAAEAANKGK